MAEATSKPAAGARASKKLFIKTWGCQMNVYDSTRMADTLAPLGYSMASDAAEADLLILNTCHIREKASEKLFSELGRLHHNAPKDKNQILAVAGCVAQAEGAEITRRMPFVNMVFGPQTYHLLPEMVAKAEGNQRVVNTDFPAEAKFDHLPTATTDTSVSAYLSVQEGCDKFCTFCVVPYTRGAEYSRPVADIIAEAKRLVGNGAREIQLLGQNVNAYHGLSPSGTTYSLANLIEEVAMLDGVARIRYSTSHPRDMSADLISAHGRIEKLMPYLHLPVQSGADAMLQAMNRKHTRDLYFKIIDELKAVQPAMAFSSDFIVGFPGETAFDHAQTMELVERVNFALAYSFKYSRRPGTPAASMPGQLKEDVKTQRLHQLQALLWQQQTAFNESKIGQTIDVLFDKPGRYDGQMQGRSPWLQPVYVNAPARVLGHVLPVRITSATQNSLQGSVILEGAEIAA